MSEKDRYRKKKLQVNLTESEMQFADEKAKYLKLTKAEMVRRYILDGAIIKYETVDIKELSKEINKIGLSINQIARCINQKGEEYDREDIENLIKEYQNLQELIYAKIWGIEI